MQARLPNDCDAAYLLEATFRIQYRLKHTKSAILANGIMKMYRRVERVISSIYLNVKNAAANVCWRK